jgi:hypothetical protein
MKLNLLYGGQGNAVTLAVPAGDAAIAAAFPLNLSIRIVEIREVA